MKLVEPPTSVKYSSSVEPSMPAKFDPAGLFQGRKGVGILVFLSIALHGGLLLLPMRWLPSAEPEPEPVIEDSGAIALTTLPVIKPAPPDVPPPDIAPPEPLPPVVEPPPAVDPSVLTDIPESLLEEEIPEDPNEPEEAEPETPTETPDNELPPDTEETEPEAGIAVPFSDDFPHMAGATSGCYGLENCRTVVGQTFRDVAKAIKQELEAKGYGLTPYDNGDSSGGNHRIYEMRLLSDPGAALKYLNIFGEGLTEARYIITPELIERGDLEALS